MQAAFGRSGQGLLRTMELGSDGIEELREQARKTGNTFDDEASYKANVFTSSIATLQASMKGLMIEIGFELIPVLLEMTQKATKWFQDIDKGVAKENFRKFLTDVVKFAKDIFPVLKGITDIAIKMIDSVGGGGNALKIIAAVWGATKLLQASSAVASVIPGGDAVAGKLGGVAGKAGLIGAAGVASYALTTQALQTEGGQKFIEGLNKVVFSGQNKKQEAEMSKKALEGQEFSRKQEEFNKAFYELDKSTQESFTKTITRGQQVTVEDLNKFLQQSPAEINFQPTINVQGNADTGVVNNLVNQMQDMFEDMMDNYQHQQLLTNTE
jgi:hypothetical protein